MMRSLSWDYPLFYITVILTVFGFLMLMTAAVGLVGKDGAGPAAVIAKQVILGGGLGFSLLIMFGRLNYRFWRRYSIFILIAAILVMAAVFIPGIGFSYGGASRWVNVGPFSFQPSEFFKLAFVCYIASWLASRKDEVKSAEFGLVPFLIMTALVGVLFLMQPDIGTLSIVVTAAVTLFYVGGGKVSHLALAGLMIMLAASAIIYFEPYRRERIMTYLNPKSDIQNSGYQLHQSLIAIGSGGIFGKGFGEGIQKFSYLPEATGDSIFAVIGEEFGFAGSASLILLFFIFMWRAIFILGHVRDQFARLFGFGIVALIIMQSFFNMAALTGVLPLTGIPLSFVSLGGSALAVNLASVGILLNISKYSKA